MFILWFNMGVDQGAAALGGTLLNMAVFAAMFSYIMQVLFFILLRRKLPRLERPYRSPFCILGASLTILIATVTVYYQLTGLIYRQGVLWMGGWFAVGILYFTLIGAHRLILSPEEEFALEHNKARAL